MPLRRRPLLAAGLLLAATAAATSAMAADVAAPVADHWTGFYLGAQVGYMDGTGSDTDFCDWAEGFGNYCFGASEGLDVGDNSMSGESLGGYVGFNYRLDSILLGLEGDLNWDGAQGNNGLGDGTNYDSSLNWDASIRARLGYLIGERALIYATGGPSWISAELGKNDYCSISYGVDVKCGDTSTELGWQLGFGAEFLLTDHLSLKAEYLHGWYGDADLNLESDVFEGIPEKYYLKQNLQTNVLRAGVAYHFGSF